jgi:hypothetical protein
MKVLITIVGLALAATACSVRSERTVQTPPPAAATTTVTTPAPPATTTTVYTR